MGLHRGIRIVTAKAQPSALDGLSALEILSSGGIDLMITGIDMPGMNGFELISKVRNEYPHVKVLVLTGGGPKKGADTYLSRAKKMGAAGGLFKPCLVDEFVKLVQETLGSK
jgi:DNA-binding NarL/FixJ family response regulator